MASLHHRTNQPTISYQQSTRCLRCVYDFGFSADCTLASELFAKRARSAQKDREGRPEMDTCSPRRRPEIRKDTKWKDTSLDTLRYQLLIIFLLSLLSLYIASRYQYSKAITRYSQFSGHFFFGQDVLMAWSMQL